MKKIRIVFPLGNQYYVESPWVQIGNDRSREVVNGKPGWYDKHFAEEEVQKGNLIIDPSMSMQDCYNVAVTGVKPSGQNGVEYGQIKATMKADADSEKNSFTIGLGKDIPSYIPSANKIVGEITVTGTYGDQTLDVIGELAKLNTIGITRMHHEASDEEVYSISPVMTTHTSIGNSGTVTLNFPQSDSDDENTNIRDMKASYLKSQGFEGGLRFNGMNYLTYNLPAGEELAISFYTVFTPK